MKKRKNITVVGAGYVGMSLSVLLSQSNDVIVHDIDEEKIKKINSGMSTVQDLFMENFLKDKELSLRATLKKKEAYKDADFIIIATPTDFDEAKQKFNTNVVESVVEDILMLNKNCLIIIKSTIPIGHTDYLRKKFSTEKIIFSPEFLREGQSLMDNLKPTRIVIGGDCEKSKSFGKILSEASEFNSIKPIFTSSSDAEAIKLFSNTYLAMRVAFFNEIDSFAIANKLNPMNIINGVSLDPRIGQGYNNPSFGYGGYCLPKDTKQLLANFKDTPQALIEATIVSNSIRKNFIAEEIIARNVKTVGFYRLIMKKGSDNFRTSAITSIINRLKETGLEPIVFEPLLDHQEDFNNFELVEDLDKFKERSELIVANRISGDLLDVESKLFTRDIFEEN